MSETDRDPVEALAGTSIRVYLYLVRRNGYVGVREVQRALGFKSPSTARHHLERLVSLGLAEKSTYGYKARPPKGLLGEFVVLRGRLVPRTLFSSGFLAAATIAYALMPGRDPAAVAVMAIASLVQAVNSVQLYRSVKRLLH